MSANQADFPIATMARVFGVSEAGYYAWRQRPPSAHAVADKMLLKRVRTIHASSRQTYGVPRVHAELRAGGDKHGRKRIARLMRAAGLVGASRRRTGVTTTRRDKDARPAPDLVERNFVASQPNQLWVADITFVATASGFLFLAVVLDAWSRKIVGWSMANHLRAELVLDALEMAIGLRRPGNVIHHSDQGSQYTSLAFGKRCSEADVRPSMGSVGVQLVPEPIAAVRRLSYLDHSCLRTAAILLSIEKPLEHLAPSNRKTRKKCASRHQNEALAPEILQGRLPKFAWNGNNYIVWVEPYMFAVGTFIAERPRTDPSGPNSGTRLLPRVSDGEAHIRPGMKDPWLGEKVIGKLRHPRPHQPCLLTAPAETPVPENGDVVAECADRRAVRRHGVVSEIAGDDLAEPSPGVGDRQVPSLPQPFLDLPQLRGRGVTSS
jgi:putative transposase